MTNPSAQPEEVWSQQRWRTLEQETRRRALAAHSDAESWEVLVKQARLVLKTYSTSFFIVTRFLPPAKRAARMPEPMTVALRRSAPIISAPSRL